MKTYDVVIIGAGVTGCMLAHKLAAYKLKVAVIEAGCDVASGATRANSAIVHAGFDAACGTLKAALNAKGCAALPEIARQLDVPYKNNTSLVVAFGEEDEKMLEVLLERGKANGVPQLEIIGKEKLNELEPNISPEATAALVAPTAGIICPYDLTIACAENAVINGVEFFFEHKIERIEREADHIVLFSGDERFETRFAVNAAGVYSAEVARMADPNFDIDIIPRRGEYMILDKAEGKTCKATLFACPNREGKGILVSPTVDGNIIVGPNAHKVSPDDTSTTSVGLDEISKGARKLIPGINLRAVITSFAGVRPTPTTDDFHIEPSAKMPELLNLVGIESPGLASSPVVADHAIGKLKEMGVVFEERDDYNPFRTVTGHMKKPLRELSEAEKLERCKEDPAYGKIICRCETVTEGDILDAIRRPIPAKTIDMVKLRTRAGMGRCQGGFCSPRVAELISSELGIELDEVTKRGGDSKLLFGKTK